jgi:hypothetical protein
VVQYWWGAVSCPQQLHHGHLPKVPLEDHRIIMLGSTQMLTQSDIMT